MMLSCSKALKQWFHSIQLKNPIRIKQLSQIDVGEDSTNAQKALKGVLDEVASATLPTLPLLTLDWSL
jgi:hypothetical protein